MGLAVELKNVGLTYQSIDSETKALDNISLEIENGEFTAFIGPSGCGKSTLLSIIAGLIAPTNGDVLVMGKTVSAPGEEAGYMLQRDNLLEWRSARQNAMLGLQIKRKCTDDALRRIDEMFDDYGLSSFRQSKPHELSGGMRQKVALIRTLALQPKLLLLDEPFSALDYQTRLTLCGEISEIIRSRRMTAILVTHDISEAVSMADRAIVFTQRPAKIKRDMRLEFQSDIPMERRNEKAFQDYFDLIWKELDAHAC